MNSKTRLILFFLICFSCSLFSQRNGRYVKRYSLFHKHILGHYKDRKKTGEWIEWNRDRTIRSIEYYYNGLRDGPYINNLNRVSGYYRMGKKDSLWKYQLNTGCDSFVNYKEDVPVKETWTQKEGYGNQRFSQGYYKGGLRDSVFVWKTANGQNFIEGRYRLGKKTGQWVFYNGSGYKSREEFFENDSLLKRVTYDPYGNWNKKVTGEEFQGGKVVRRYTISWFDANHKEKEEYYIDPSGTGDLQKDSVWTTWNKAGEKLTEIYWKAGKKDGSEKHYSTNVLVLEKNYKGGLLDGICTSWSPKGGKEHEVYYVKNLKQGEETWLYPDGKMRKRSTYVRDTLHGPAEEWYPDGQKQSEMQYDMGFLAGKHTVWDKNGKVLHTKVYSRKDEHKVPVRTVGTDDLSGGNSTTMKDPPAGEDELLTFAEEMPQFPGGQEAMYKFISSVVKYPELEREAGISGKVWISFVVGADGGLTDIQVIKGVNGGKGLEKEALRVIKLMPPWAPGRINGKPVRVKFTIPINFVIK
jgi:TonB family protein